MRRLIDRCAGIDVGQALLVVCVRLVDSAGKLTEEIRSFGPTTPDLLELRDWLAGASVTHVAMESTGVYWKAPYYLLEDEFEVLLVNAAHLKHVPDRKTDVIDAQWIAEILSYGLLRPSFVPPRPFRELRDLTRYRKALIRARTAEVNRLHKVLEDAGVKLATVATDVMGGVRAGDDARPDRRGGRPGHAGRVGQGPAADQAGAAAQGADRAVPRPSRVPADPDAGPYRGIGGRHRDVVGADYRAR
jgi:transposase